MTTLQPQTWEYTLLGLAHEALHPAVLAVLKPVANRHLLQRAYAYCTELTSAHSRSFYLATRWLPAEKRRAIRALYAFCRVSDDIVDCGDCDVEKKLAAWRHAALSSQPATNDLVATAWADARLRYRIPQRYAEQLIEGVARPDPEALSNIRRPSCLCLLDTASLKGC